jgi:biopolymer transport protein ExbD
MLSRSKHKRLRPDAELDITSFMNLMIVLVPVLLMMMVFSRITVVELQLPGLDALPADQSIDNQQLEVLVTQQGFDVFFPQGYLVRSIPKVALKPDQTLSIQQPSQPLNEDYDFAQLQTTLIQVKRTLLAKQIDKNDLVLMLDDDISYQTIVTLLDTVRSYPDVVAASVVAAELFPNASLADAPLRATQSDEAVIL